MRHKKYCVAVIATFGALAMSISLCAQDVPTWKTLVIDKDSPSVVQVDPKAFYVQIIFDSSLDHAVTLECSRLIQLAPNARIVYERNDAAFNQTINAPVATWDTVTIVNDNDWTHDAHMLRLTGQFLSRGDVVIEGKGKGGVEINSHREEEPQGEIIIKSGRLIVSSDHTLGATTKGTRLSGGDLFLRSGVTVRDEIVVEEDSSISLGGDAGLAGDITVYRGAALTVDTGGGNAATVTGTLRGGGNIIWIGGGATPELIARESIIAGEESNTLSGTFTVLQGTVALAKPSERMGKEVDAIAGDLVIGGGSNEAVVALHAPNQINNRAQLTFQGPIGGVLALNKHNERVGPIDLQGDGELDLGETSGNVFSVGDCSAKTWQPGAQLFIDGWWQGATVPSGRVRFGGSNEALTKDQLNQIGFTIASWLVERRALYAAKLIGYGQVEPGELVRSTRPLSKRARPYLRDGDVAGHLDSFEIPGDLRVSFFGDSITWQNRYVDRVITLLKDRTPGGGEEMRFFNRGINGAGIRDVRDGFHRNAHEAGGAGGNNDAPQKSFAEVLQDDKPDIAVVFIGINDVKWKGTTDQEFQQAVGDLVDTAARLGVKIVFASPAVDGEKPGGLNENDERIERLGEIMETTRPDRPIFVNLRAAFVSYLEEHNNWLRLDGSVRFKEKGLLTYDGIHPTEEGNRLIAENIAVGIVRSIKWGH